MNRGLCTYDELTAPHSSWKPITERLRELARLKELASGLPC
jgi:hypothetical protein